MSGFRSYAFRWFTGYSVSGTGPLPPEPPVPPAELCPCPDYGVDPTLTNSFNQEATVTNQFSKEQTLTPTWKRGTCNG